MLRSFLSKTVLVAALLSAACFLAFGDEIPIIPAGNPGENGDIIFRSPSSIPIECEWIESSSSICTNILLDLGSVTIEIENQTTGEYNLTLVNALAGPMVLPISGTAGRWTITFTLSSGTVYIGEFYI